MNTDKLAEITRNIVRPVVTLLGFSVLAYGAVRMVPIPEDFKAMVALMIGFWFGSRNGENKNIPPTGAA